MLNNELKIWIERVLNNKINTERIYIFNNSNINTNLNHGNIRYVPYFNIDRLISTNKINSIVDTTNYSDNENILKNNLDGNFFLIENNNINI